MEYELSETMRSAIGSVESVTVYSNVAFGSCLVVSFFLGLVSKKFWISGLLGILCGVAAFLIQDNFLTNWWITVNNTAVSDEDRMWLAHHDGGIMIAGLVLTFKSGLVFMAAVFATWIKYLIKIRKNEGRN